MPRWLRAEVASISELLSGARWFVAPTYQRPFQWTEEEAGALLADIRDAQIAAQDGRDDGAAYFLGAVVFAQGVGSDAAELIDGQQRLTTLTILLALIRDLDVEDDDDRIDRCLLVGGEKLGQASGRIRPRPRDVEFFFRNIQRTGATVALDDETPIENDSQAKMLAVALSLRDALEEMSAGARRWLADFILRSCVVVAVSTQQDDQGYRIFQVLNARGSGLTDVDLLKSELLGAVAPHRRDRLVAVWEAIEGALGEEDFSHFFSHLRMTRTPGKARRATFAEIRQTFQPAADPERFLAEEVEAKGQIFRALLVGRLRLGAHSNAGDTLLRSLRRLSNQDWAAPAMAFLADPDRSDDGAYVFIKALERLAYALLLQSGDLNLRIARYSKLIKAINDRQPLDVLLRYLDLSANDKKTARTVLDKAFYQKERARLPVLLRIDERLAETVASYDTTQVSVEHVLPQNPPPDSAWLKAWPDPVERKRWTDRLGNLALLSRRKNQEAANLPFDRKKREYFARGWVTPFALTTQVLIEPDWTPDVVRRRHELLYGTACKIWEL